MNFSLHQKFLMDPPRQNLIDFRRTKQENDNSIYDTTLVWPSYERIALEITEAEIYLR